MKNLKICLLKALNFFKKTNVNDKRPLKIFFNKILPLKPINNKKVVKQNTDKFIYEGDTRTFNVKQVENEFEGDDDNLGKVNDNGDDDNKSDDNGDIDINDDNNGDYDDDSDGGDNDSNPVDGVIVNGDVSIIKHLICKT